MVEETFQQGSLSGQGFADALGRGTQQVEVAGSQRCEAFGRGKKLAGVQAVQDGGGGLVMVKW